MDSEGSSQTYVEAKIINKKLRERKKERERERETQRENSELDWSSPALLAVFILQSLQALKLYYKFYWSSRYCSGIRLNVI